MVETMFEYIHFFELERKPKTSVWSCRMNLTGDELGIVKWYPAWRQYCYFPTGPVVYSAGCLRDIDKFIGQLMDERDG